MLVFQKLFSFFYPFFKPLQISFKFTCTPALMPLHTILNSQPLK